MENLNEIKYEQKTKVSDEEKDIVEEINNALSKNKSWKSKKEDGDILKKTIESQILKKNNDSKQTQLNNSSEGNNSVDKKFKNQINIPEGYGSVEQFLIGLEEKFEQVEDAGSILEYNYEKFNEEVKNELQKTNYSQISYSRLSSKIGTVLGRFAGEKKNDYYQKLYDIKETLSKIEEGDNERNSNNFESAIDIFSELLSSEIEDRDLKEEFKKIGRTNLNAIKYKSFEIGEKMLEDASRTDNVEERIAILDEAKEYFGIIERLDEGILKNVEKIENGIGNIQEEKLLFNQNEISMGFGDMYKSAKDKIKLCEKQIKDLQDSSITVMHKTLNYLPYPNPATNEVNINLGQSNPDGINGFQLIDIKGSIVASEICEDKDDFEDKYITKNDYGEKIFSYKDLNNLATGIYIIRLLNSETNFYKANKFIKL